MSFPSGAMLSAGERTADNEPVLHPGIDLKMEWELIKFKFLNEDQMTVH